MRSPEGQELSELCYSYGYRLADTPGDLTRYQIGFLIAALNRRAELQAFRAATDAGVTRIVLSDEAEEE